MSWLQLGGRTAIVTGAASGIGRATAKTLMDAGCRVIQADLRSDDQNVVQCDVSKREHVDNLMKGIGDASILVNCAGITRDSLIHGMTAQDWDDVINVNLTGTFHACQSFLSHQQGLHQASIINVSSVVFSRGSIGQANYAASKGGVVGLTRALAKEGARINMRVNAISPGFIDTPMSAAVPTKIIEKMKSKIPSGKLGRPEDVANLAAFLASERSQYITGEVIECSGMIAL